jgi:hypothetical protein
MRLALALAAAILTLAACGRSEPPVLMEVTPGGPPVVIQ